ncbi:DUF2019 domain-containing protein [Hymenobacter elongatus]|uniref:DUF2019 domain-containing protein n=1 Tax=Hymenobacter elongatus TaxID=877208 RepID=A0A4Z0PR84_9BACT|nr:DUF2019 domain-containing protein [Hymenobacter elongatus]TGE20230.1 DUF2019 domain-containing protein [Hymenobacter elongatus]
MPIHHQTEALELFCLAAARQAEATAAGTYRVGNKAYDQIIKAVKWLAANQAIPALCPLLHAENVGIRLWAASVLLPYGSPEAEEALAALASSASVHGLIAATTLNEWRAGRLQIIS